MNNNHTIESLGKFLCKMLEGGDILIIARASGVDLAKVRSVLLFPEEVGSTMSIQEIYRISCAVGVAPDKFLDFFGEQNFECPIDKITSMIASLPQKLSDIEQECGWSLSNIGGFKLLANI